MFKACRIIIDHNEWPNLSQVDILTMVCIGLGFALLILNLMQ